MNRRGRSIFIAAAAFVAAFVPAQAAGAAVRYAGAGVSGGTCIQADPCPLATALSGTASGDTTGGSGNEATKEPAAAKEQAKPTPKIDATGTMPLSVMPSTGTKASAPVRIWASIELKPPSTFPGNNWMSTRPFDSFRMRSKAARMRAAAL